MEDHRRRASPASSVSDGFFGGSIGDVAVSTWDPNVVYVGTGEVTVRGNVSEGDGVWKSTDAGKTWKRAGLADSRHITRIRIHPRNPDLVYAAVLGHLFGASAERGIYRSGRRRRHLETLYPLRRRPGRGGRPRHGPDQPARPLRLDVAHPPRTPYSLEQRRPRLGAMEVDRRRRAPGKRAHRQPRPAQGHQGHHRRQRVAHRSRQRLRHRRGGGRRPFPLGRQRRHLEAHQHRPRADPARLVLQPRLRRSGGRRVRLRGERLLSAPEGRRPRTFTADPRAARRQPRPVGLAGRPAADDRGERRQRERQR